MKKAESGKRKAEGVTPYIGWMCRRHMPEVQAIEAASFEFPWDEDTFAKWLRERNVVGQVAEHGDRVVGYMVYELVKNRIHLNNLAVAADVRRRSIGAQLLGKLQAKLVAHGRTRVTAEVRESNLPAQQFLRACGFRATAVVRGHYQETSEDAYRFVYRFGTSCRPGEAINRLTALQRFTQSREPKAESGERQAKRNLDT